MKTQWKKQFFKNDLKTSLVESSNIPSEEPNAMSLNKGFFSFALDSANQMFDVWTRPRSIATLIYSAGCENSVRLRPGSQFQNCQQLGRGI